MTNPKERTLAADLAAFGWALLALIAFFIALWYLTGAGQQFGHWLCADRYVAGELEVTRFDPSHGRRKQMLIDGVVHPSGERVLLTSIDIAREFIDPSERGIRFVPLPNEMERRLPVWYWPDHMSEYRWWHSPTVILPGATQTAGGVARSALLGIAYGVVCVFCLRRCYRHVKATAPPVSEGQYPPAWFGIALVLGYLGVMALMAYLMSL